MKILNIHKKGRVVFIFILSAIVLLELYFLIFLRQKVLIGNIASETDLQKYARQVQDKCKGSNYKASCYDREIPKLMDYISMEDAFNVTKIIQKTDDQYKYCHVLGHKLSGREMQKDPSKWKDIIARCPATMCNNGCLHGPLLARFNNETLTDSQIEKIMPDLKSICEPRAGWKPSSLEISVCYHGLGHLNMYITGANVQKSVDLCYDESIKSDGRNYQQTCIQGIFMQIYQPLEPEDVALIKNIRQTKETVEQFCAQFTGDAFSACHNESWPLFRKEIEKSEGLTKFCTFSDDEMEQRKCFSNTLGFLTTYYVIDSISIDKLTNFCMGLRPQNRGNCFGDAAMRMMQIDPSYRNTALKICENAHSLSGDCYRALASYAPVLFADGSKEFVSYCKLLPQPYQKQCLNKEIKMH